MKIRNITMVAALICAGIMPAGANRPDASTGTFKTLISEDFSLFTAGSADSPDATSVIEDGKVMGNIPSALTHTPGWRGAMVYQAGGMAHVGIFNTGIQSMTGIIITPTVEVTDPDSYYIVSIKAKSAGATDNMEFSMNYGEGSGLSFAMEPISAEWSEPTVMFSADNNVSTVYFTFNTSRRKVLVDDVKVELYTPHLKAPKARPASDYTGNSFVARWSEVAEADSYLLSVFSEKANGDRVFVFTDREENSTEALVENLDPTVTYSYYVKARNSSYTSPESAVITVKGVTAPSPSVPADADDNGFTAGWEPVPLATNYELWAYHHHTATEAEEYVLTDEKFSKITSQGTVTDPESFGETFDDSLTPYMSQPGWNIHGGIRIDGAVGMDAGGYIYGVPCQLISPEMDLSGGDRSVTVSFRAWVSPRSASDHQTVPVISMLRANPGDNPETVDQYVAEDITPGRWVNIEATLKNGNNRAQICIFPYGNEGYLFVDNLKITKHIEPKEDIYKPVYYKFTTDTDVKVACTKPSADCWAYRVRSWRIEGDYNISDWSEYAHSIAPSSVADVTGDSLVAVSAPAAGVVCISNNSDADVVLCDVSGRVAGIAPPGARSTFHVSPGIYIAGRTKICVR